MKKLIILTLSFLSITNSLVAEDTPRDTLRVVDVEDVIVIATPKEHRKLRQLPAAVTLLSQTDMQANQVKSMKNLTALVPNIFIPDYGSRLTSAIYIRGIGSRINTPSVGLYVDNVPYVDKSAFDFSYADVERIDVLRGPQGTLYGRNAMGGLIRVHTKSPFSYQGTDLRLSAATYGNLNASLTHYHRINERFAFSAGGFYERADGFFRNSYNQKLIDPSEAGGGRMRAIWLPQDNLKFDLNVSYEYGDQGGYPYHYTGVTEGEEDRQDYIGKISIKDESNYRRGLFNTALTIEHQARNFTLSAVTGYQNLRDRMAIDQDFSELDIFTLVQKQRIHTLSEEVVLKSRPGRNWEWTTGTFGFYQWLNTDGPVQFKDQGIQTMIEDNVNSIFAGLPANAPKMNLSIKDTQLLSTGNFDTPALNLALYHQSTFNNLFAEGLSFTAGLRLDYEKTSMKYRAGFDDMNYDFAIQMGPMPISLPITTTLAALKGKEKNDYLQLLPKFALKYDFDGRNNVYASVSKGYRSGGYNVQMFSDIIQSRLAAQMVDDVKGTAKDYMLGMGIPSMTEERIDQILSVIPDMTDPTSISESTVYKPEYSWNYEAGAHLTLINNRLYADLAAFYMDTRDQQIARFSENGFGRITVNAGRSRSYGAEAAVRSQITNALSLNVNYGYTHATFRNYENSGNYVPFVPQHTFSANGQYIWHLGERKTLRQLTFNLGYNGAGKIYWTEANDVSQSFYGTVNARISAMLGSNIQVDVWGQNIFDEDYTTFYFESMQKGFMQKGRPAQVGVDVRLRF
ncbi:TonB-dependent receptor [Bacteroides sp. OttesenSCG-928-E20]|nr:TonB-dependent receptor [Bacteroides sp. OttesenSCG-928-N06]MDL2299555.1 TonB-dependent receptor [Bacteroides sp. OttesenSCG-928-E20]MDL2305902.1 TonB-dependent receptor [Bacteroides sp. OttesenSCG-928-D19]